jgi:asparagine synthase (glutamine-hydrolysing)
MSALAGIRYFDNRPVGEETICALSQFNRLRGPHRYGTFVQPGIALIACGLHFDELSHREQQPVVTPSGLISTFEGRLDNREDLTLRYRRESGLHPTDGALVAHHLQAAGRDGLVDLIGDFSVAAWDPRHRSILLACDYAGNRPLHYVVTSTYVVWSTCLETLVRFEHAEDRLDDQYVAGALTLGTPAGRTPFQGILRVPANTVIVIDDAGHIAQHALWNFAVGSIRYRRSESYVEQMRALLDEAVRTRMRAEAPVWADLSGGLDSSAIVAFAQQQIDTGRVEAPALRTFSRLFPGSPESDERPFIEAVRNWTGCHGVEVEDCADFRDSFVEQAFCPFRFDPIYRHMERHLTQTRSVVWLSGGVGDLIMGKTIAHSIGLMDYLSEGGMRPFLKRTFQYAHFMNDTLLQVWMDLWREHGSPTRVAQRHAQATARRMGLPDPNSDTAIARHFGLDEGFVARAHPRIDGFVDNLNEHPVSKRHLIAGIRAWTTMNAAAATSDSLYGSRISYPYLHRPLVAFVLAIPGSVMWEPGRPRALMRAALQSLLPPLVLERQDKGYASPAYTRILRPHAMAMLSKPRWRVAEAGYVDRTRYEPLLKQLIDGRKLPPGCEMVLVLETWLSRSRTVPSTSIAPDLDTDTRRQPVAAH